MFRCRQDELKKLNKRFEDKNFECIVIYGRRRVGKTALINEFCKDKKNIYYSALNATEQENLQALSRAIYACKEPDSESFPVYSSFDSAFDEIGKMAKDDRIVFVIDEFPYLAKVAPSVSSKLQHLIDHKWSETKLYLILCGSSMSFMEYQVLGYESPLYGRRTAQFKIEPLTYKDTAVFHPDLTPEENALIYGITGGVPHYINKLDVRGSLDEALLENLFERSGYLYEEPENLLKQELREPTVYNSIIRAIAEGSSRMNEIATKTGIETGPCSKYLHTLISLGIIKKESPITEKQGKKTIYLIADNFFRFWYRFVPQHVAAISAGRFQQLYNNAVKARLNEYMGLIFEKMCKEYLLYYAADTPFLLNQIGRWWGNDSKRHKEIQVDIVAPSEDEKKFIIGSCKFRSQPVGMEELELLKQYASAFRPDGKHYYYIFSKSGFTKGLRDAAERNEVTLITLEDMYA